MASIETPKAESKVELGREENNGTSRLQACNCAEKRSTAERSAEVLNAMEASAREARDERRVSTDSSTLAPPDSGRTEGESTRAVGTAARKESTLITPESRTEGG
jgi:hypothetical protein